MSERGSFVTEYIYCHECLEAAYEVLGRKDKYLTGIQIPTWDDTSGAVPYLPIIAGKIGGTWPGNEVFTFEEELTVELGRVICHPLRVAVLGEKGERIFTILPTDDTQKSS